MKILSTILRIIKYLFFWSWMIPILKTYDRFFSNKIEEIPNKRKRIYKLIFKAEMILFFLTALCIYNKSFLITFPFAYCFGETIRRYILFRKSKQFVSSYEKRLCGMQNLDLNKELLNLSKSNMEVYDICSIPMLRDDLISSIVFEEEVPEETLKKEIKDIDYRELTVSFGSSIFNSILEFEKTLISDYMAETRSNLIKLTIKIDIENNKDHKKLIESILTVNVLNYVEFIPVKKINDIIDRLKKEYIKKDQFYMTLFISKNISVEDINCSHRFISKSLKFATKDLLHKMSRREKTLFFKNKFKYDMYHFLSQFVFIFITLNKKSFFQSLWIDRLEVSPHRKSNSIKRITLHQEKELDSENDLELYLCGFYGNSLLENSSPNPIFSPNNIKKIYKNRDVVSGKDLKSGQNTYSSMSVETILEGAPRDFINCFDNKVLVNKYLAITENKYTVANIIDYLHDNYDLTQPVTNNILKNHLGGEYISNNDLLRVINKCFDLLNKNQNEKMNLLDLNESTKKSIEKDLNLELISFQQMLKFIG